MDEYVKMTLRNGAIRDASKSFTYGCSWPNVQGDYRGLGTAGLLQKKVQFLVEDLNAAGHGGDPSGASLNDH